MVPTGGGQFDRAPAALLAEYVGEIRPGHRWGCAGDRWRRPQWHGVAGERDQFPQGVRRAYGHAGHQVRLGGVGDRDDDLVDAGPDGGEDGGQHAPDRADGTVESQLTDDGGAAQQVDRDDPVAGEHGDGDGEVECRTRAWAGGQGSG